MIIELSGAFTGDGTAQNERPKTSKTHSGLYE